MPAPVINVATARTGASDSRSTAAVTSTNVVVATRTGISDSRSVATAPVINVATARTALAASRSTIGVTNVNGVATARTGLADSRSAVPAPVIVFKMTFTAAASFEDDPESDVQYSQTIQVDADATINIPSWCKKIDGLVVGGGGGSTGNALLAAGIGGEGGAWNYGEFTFQTLLTTQGLTTPDRYTAVFTIGNGGNGGPGPSVLQAIQNGQAGIQSTMNLNAITGTTPRAIATLRGTGGAAGFTSNGTNPGGPSASPGKATTGGNSPALVNRDVSLNPPQIINGVSETVYRGGSTTAAGATVASAPGGGGPAPAAGGSTVGRAGAKGRGFIRMYSAGSADRQSLSWTAVGAFSAIIPLNTLAVVPAALGGGAGGGGGTLATSGGGGQGGRWAMLATSSSFWDVDALLAAAGFTRAQVTQLRVTGTVGAGGNGGGAGVAGGPGRVSTVSLIAVVSGTDRTLGTITTTAAAAGQVGAFLDAYGLACTGGNINLDGAIGAESSRDLRVFLRGKAYSFRGGGPTTTGNGVGRAPGGGGGGGAVLNGSGNPGATGAAHVVFTSDATSRRFDELEIIEYADPSPDVDGTEGETE
jgi:hypothetical protein